VLDDLKHIANRDKSDALGKAAKAPSQLRYGFGTDIGGEYKPQNVVLAGMGGSALGANLFIGWTSPGLPVAVTRHYDIPGFVGKRTLFIASSYSGNTEETLSALAQAESAGAKIVAIASGGRLADLAREKSYPLFELPGGLQPRMAVFYSFRALAELFEALGLMSDLTAQLETAAHFMEQAQTAWQPDVPTAQNPAKEIAEEIAGKTPVIYAGPRLSPVAYKWKISINETAKNAAFYNQWPEFNHNEMVGWTSHPVEKPFAPIELLSSFEHERVLKRFTISNRLLSGRMPHPLQIQAEGNSLLEHMLWTVLLGDYVSIYLALINNVDPTPVEIIEKLKDELTES
jgi:glucose/mannose-6-phosphate isomerase